MSRAAVSKSRADKGAKPGPPAHTPVVAHEIVPGKFNDQDWTFMVEKDGSEEFVEDIIDELVDNTLDVIYDNYVGQQLLPFTVTMAKDAILQIIEWQFLSRDEGEQDVETDQGWMEDEEPDPAVTDCWAQGSVPKALVPEKPMTPVEETIEENVEEEAAAEEVEEAQVEEEEPPELADKVSDTEEGPNQEEVQKTKEEEKKKKRTKYKPYTGRVKAGKGLNQMTESLEQTEMAMMYEEYVKSQEYEAAEKASGLLNMPVSCHSILKVQAGRPPGNKDVMYDDMGNVLAVIKLNPEKLPSHRVKVKYQVVDPAVEAAQARLEAMRHGRYMSRAIQRRLKRNKVEEIRPDEGKSLQVWTYQELLAIEMCQNPVKGNYGAVSILPTCHRLNYHSGSSASQAFPFASIRDSIPARPCAELEDEEQKECLIHTHNNSNTTHTQNSCDLQTYNNAAEKDHTGIIGGDNHSIHDLVSMIIELKADVKKLHSKLDEMRNLPKEKVQTVDCGTQTGQSQCCGKGETEHSEKLYREYGEKGQIECSEKGYTESDVNSQTELGKKLVMTYAEVVSQRSVTVRQKSKSSLPFKTSGNYTASSVPPSVVRKRIISSSPTQLNMESPCEDIGVEGRSSPYCTLLVGSSILRLVERKKLQFNMDVRTYRGAKINTVRERLLTMTLSNYRRLIIHVGGDDVSSGRSEQDIQSDFTHLTSSIHSTSPDIQIVYVAITPRTDCDVIPTNRNLQEMCNKQHLDFIPSYRVFVDNDNFQRNGLYSRDGIHLTKYGTALFLKNIDRSLSHSILRRNPSESSNHENVS